MNLPHKFKVGDRILGVASNGTVICVDEYTCRVRLDSLVVLVDLNTSIHKLLNPAPNANNNQSPTVNFNQLALLAGVTGWMQEPEIDQLVVLAAGKRVLEVGSFKGLSAFCMGIVAESVTCVDTFSADASGASQSGEVTTLGAFQAATKRFRNISHFVGTSELAATSPDGPHGTFDLVLIDATHEYDDCKQDIQLWWPRVKPGGLLVFHDYGHTLNSDGTVAGGFPGVTKAVDEIFGPAPVGTVVVSLRWVVK